MSHPPARYLFRTDELQVGEFHCDPGHPLWDEENNIGAGHHVVFPGTAVRITHAGAEPVVSTPNHAIFYNSFASYRRELIGDRGDHCVFLIVEPELPAEIALAAGARPPRQEFRFEFTHGPLAAAAYLAQQMVVRRLKDGRDVDELSVHETLLEIVAAAVGGAYRVRGHGRRRSTNCSAGVVEAVKEILAVGFHTSTSLAELSGAVYMSPYHLARQFRARTGYTIRGYRNQLRLRTSLEALAGGDESLASIALRLGFASHSHFTDSFRRTFGASPSSIRRQARRSSASESERT